MKFHMVIAIILNFNLWIHKNFVCPLHGHKKGAYCYVMEAKNVNCKDMKIELTFI